MVSNARTGSTVQEFPTKPIQLEVEAGRVVKLEPLMILRTKWAQQRQKMLLASGPTGGPCIYLLRRVELKKSE
jgi:hypothetical protein